MFDQLYAKKRKQQAKKVNVEKNFIQISYKKEEFDVLARSKICDIKTAGYDVNFDFRVEHLYSLDGNLEIRDLNIIAKELLVDPIIQNYKINTSFKSKEYINFYIADVWLKKGVTDSVGETIEKSIKSLGINKEIKVKTGIRYLIEKKKDIKEIREIIEKLFVNSIINELFFENIF
ncbi:MAG: phosphoribosylformylglycinamidine synthase subunit PurS [Elusimicrobiota bacterium]|jgi:phosphoribosylformylglycinamidine synthase|nr:phosphoribosylformylglycinamidine synthase subunit PurS [Elusimicrobiota bacterium]